jgi:MFS family permease
MILRPKQIVTEPEVQRGLKLVIGDGLAAEAMTTLTGGAFLIAMALLLGASNFQIGLLASLPTFTNLFQLLSIWLVRRYNNRRAVAVLCGLLARLPLLIIGSIALLAPESSSIQLIIVFLFFYQFFGSIAGPSWNSWIKDLVPENKMGAYFSRRGSYTQILNVVLSLSVALLVDYIKKNYPAYELSTYAIMFITGGAIGIIGSFILSMAPEPQSYLEHENIIRLLKRPLQDRNFRSLLIFNSAWVFALNIATPFFTVFMMKGMGLSLSYIIGLTIISQLCSILTIRIWGLFADRYSNKTIIAISAPLYITCIVAWCFVGIYSQLYANLILLVIIHIVTGASTSGINLSLTNIGLKLAPRDDAIVYLSAKNIITAFFSSIAPLIGGMMADFFAQRHISIDATWGRAQTQKTLHLVSLHDWNFLFLIGAILALVALDLLGWVKETGEVKKDVVVRIMRSSIKSNLKDYFLIGNLLHWRDQLRAIIKKKTS